MKTISKISDTPEWMSKFAGGINHPHEDGYLDEIVNKLSEEELRNFVQKMLLEIDDNGIAMKVLKEMDKCDRDNSNFKKKSEDKEYNINPDKAIIRNYDETPNDADINY
jgi:hypothetical protein